MKCYHVVDSTFLSPCIAVLVAQALLVNSELGGPTIAVHQGERLTVTVVNEVRNDFPVVSSGGVSIHWHGLHVTGLPWLDGFSYVSQCPIPYGSNFTYSWVVQDPPGTYFWHGHNGVELSDGLRGPLIVKPPRGMGGNEDVAQIPSETIGSPKEEKELTLMVSDWYTKVAGESAKALNFPFDTSRQTNQTGAFTWIGNPRSLILNQQGCASDCVLGPNATEPLCHPQPDCDTRFVWEVESNTTYLIRLIGAGSLVYQTICFEGHNITVVASDARPVDPFTPPSGSCVDINLGQRYDIELTTNATPGLYWISSLSSFRPGTPAGYGVMKYREAPDNNAKLPSTSPPQPGEGPTPWILDGTINTIVGAPGRTPSPPKNVSQTVSVQITQPLLEQTGQIRWALGNVANLLNPPCKDLLSLTANQRWVQENTVNRSSNDYFLQNTTLPGLGQQEGGGESAIFVDLPIVKAGSSMNGTGLMPKYPVAGVHLVNLRYMDVVDLILQNNAANSFNGDYRIPEGASRNTSEEHPIHLHGHTFWVLGEGNGTYDPAASLLNEDNPRQGDTVTLAPEGWAVIRFVADNPGMWGMHCHISVHEFMGQMLAFNEARDMVGDIPSNLPECPETCIYNAAPWESAVLDFFPDGVSP